MNSFPCQTRHTVSLNPVSLICWLFITLVLSSQIQARDMEAIIKAGTLRVGTTGDYAPLTKKQPDGSYEGMAIDMAHSLGQYLSREANKTITVEFVDTSWPTLSDDMGASKFDIAMGGVSRTEQRALYFSLTDTVYEDGKVALMRCEDAAQLKDKTTEQLLEAFNGSHYKVVENPGGTNEKLARKWLPDAAINMTEDNAQPFQWLLQKRADIMVTDRIEAIYWQRKGSGLCPVNAANPFNRTEKVYMLERSSPALLKAVNSWLQTPEARAIVKKWTANGADK
ncbi:transporter substrate-binding domain-containing protein [Endozoicomonadaceae bacterium StTr2]